MRVILDTNVLVSALLTEHGNAARLLDAWVDGGLTLITSIEQIEELAAVTRHPRVRPLITPSMAGRLINDLRQAALLLERLPTVDRSPDPGDNYLLAMAELSDADYLVTGDKRHLLSLRQHGRARIVTVRRLLELLAGDRSPAG